MRDAAILADLGDERREGIACLAIDGRQCLDEDLCHLRPSEILTSLEHEHTGEGALDGLQREAAIADPEVLAENDPATARDLRQPDFVSLARREVICMDLDTGARGPQGVGDDVPTERFIDEDDGLVRQLGCGVRARIGRLLRCRLGRVRSPLRDHPWSLRPYSARQ